MTPRKLVLCECGRPIPGARSGRSGPSVIDPLPSAQLAAAIDRRASRSDLPAVCELAGVHERQVTRWRRQEQPDIPAAVADQVLVGLDLLWWDVWNENTVRKPAIVVRTYSRKQKVSHGQRKPFRQCTRTIPYGDLGPDVATLDEIGRVFTGEALAA